MSSPLVNYSTALAAMQAGKTARKTNWPSKKVAWCVRAQTTEHSPELWDMVPELVKQRYLPCAKHVPFSEMLCMAEDGKVTLGWEPSLPDRRCEVWVILD